MICSLCNWKRTFFVKACEKSCTQVHQVKVIPSDRPCVYLTHLLWPEVFQLLLHRSIYHHLSTENRVREKKKKRRELRLSGVHILVRVRCSW